MEQPRVIIKGPCLLFVIILLASGVYLLYENNIFIDENKVISIIIALRRDSLRPADMDAARLSELCVGA